MKEFVYAHVLRLCDEYVRVGREVTPADVDALNEAIAAEAPGTTALGAGASAGGAAGGAKSASDATASAAPRSAAAPPAAPRGALWVSFDTVLCVYRQQYQRHIRRTSYAHRKAIAKYVQRYKRGESIADIAAAVNYSCYQLARLLVEHLLQVSKARVSQLVKQPSLIPDGSDNGRLRGELEACIEMDSFCSPFVDRVRHSVGEEYEYVLQQLLRNRGIPFESEDALRKRGLPKTPDVKLSVPIAVRGPDGRGRVVNWIDSKGMFGDTYVHETQNWDQLIGYVNRYGPGMVIYWFDFVESLNTHKDVLLVSEFPAVMRMPGAAHAHYDLDFCTDGDTVAPPLPPLPASDLPGDIEQGAAGGGAAAGGAAAASKGSVQARDVTDPREAPDGSGGGSGGGGNAAVVGLRST